MQIAVLGRLEVRSGHDVVEIGPRKQRALLAALALRAGRTVPLDELADLMWGDAAPTAADASLHGYVAALGRLHEPERARSRSEIARPLGAAARPGNGTQRSLPRPRIAWEEFRRLVERPGA